MDGQNCSSENRRQSSVSVKEAESKETSLDLASPVPKIPKKFINNWKQACGRTKDRTKELLKKWRTLPEGMQAEITSEQQSTENNSKWSEHIWNTWVKRSPSGEEILINLSIKMTDVQRKKFEYFFISYLDLDRDDVISLTDFEAFAERIRHFSDWSKNSSEYHRLKEVQRGFIEEFLLPEDLQSCTQSYESLEKKIRKEQLSLHQWLEKWTWIINESHNFFELPLWLQYFPKILFKAINTSETGVITKEEITAFFSSVLGLSSLQLGTFGDEAYDVLTSKGQHKVTYDVYRLSFANFIFGKYPNGPGLYLFGPMTGVECHFFPIDYSAFNTAPEDLEHYSPQVKTNRRSVFKLHPGSRKVPKSSIKAKKLTPCIGINKMEVTGPRTKEINKRRKQSRNYKNQRKVGRSLNSTAKKGRERFRFKAFSAVPEIRMDNLITLIITI